ncbi:MAG: WG repeat-containing protein [Turicibacter sp.]|nr:WG repeat-containing protein [Turicibacter sp.]
MTCEVCGNILLTNTTCRACGNKPAESGERPDTDEETLKRFDDVFSHTYENVPEDDFQLPLRRASAHKPQKPLKSKQPRAEKFKKSPFEGLHFPKLKNPLAEVFQKSPKSKEPAVNEPPMLKDFLAREPQQPPKLGDPVVKKTQESATLRDRFVEKPEKSPSPMLQDHLAKKPQESPMLQDHLMESPRESAMLQDHLMESPRESAMLQDHLMESPRESPMLQDHLIESPQESPMLQDHLMEKPLVGREDLAARGMVRVAEFVARLKPGRIGVTAVVSVLFGLLIIGGLYFFMSPDEDSYAEAEEFEENEIYEAEEAVVSTYYSWRLAIEPIYAQVSDFKNGLAIAYIAVDGQNFLWGMINEAGEEVVPFIYSTNSPDLVSHNFMNYRYIPANLEGYWGVIDDRGQVVLPFVHAVDTFDIAQEERMILTFTHTAYGIFTLIDIETGNEIISAEDNFRISFPQFGRMIIVDMSSEFGDPLAQTGVMDIRTAEIILPTVHRNIFIHENIAIIQLSSGEWGAVNLDTGVQIVAPEYDEIQIVSPDLIFVRADGLWGIYNQFGKLTAENRFSSIRGIVNFVEDGDNTFMAGASIQDEMGNEQWGIIDIYGTEVLPFIHDQIGWSILGDSIVVSMGSLPHMLHGVASTIDGSLVVPIIYDSIMGLAGSANHVAVMIGEEESAWGWASGSWGIVHLATGEIVLPIAYDRITGLSNGLVEIVVNMQIAEEANVIDGRSGIFNTHENALTLPPIYDSVRVLSDSLIAIGLGNHSQGVFHIFEGFWGVVDLTGREILPIAHNVIGSAFVEGLAIINVGATLNQDDSFFTGGYWGFINILGEVVIPPEMPFNQVRNPSNGMIAVQSETGLWGFAEMYAP